MTTSKIETQRGIALVMVLWLLVLMTVIASSHSRNIRTETRLASNHVDSGKARHLAEAGVYHSIMEMLVSDNNTRWPADGSLKHIRFDDGEVVISVRDTRGLVDINKATNALLDGILAGAGVEDDLQRQRLVDAILDWRDSDNLKHLHGAEDEDYQIAGLSWGARDGLFTSVEEFRYILGMTNTIYRKLAPYLTVHSGQTGISKDFAPPWLAEVINAHPGLSFSTGTTTGQSTYDVNVVATTAGGTRTSLSAVVKISNQGKEPYKILSWRSPAQSFAPDASKNTQQDNA